MAMLTRAMRCLASCASPCNNSMTRILIKPSHIIGGYGQLSFAFNYLGPTGNNRDEVTMLRKRTAPLEY